MCKKDFAMVYKSKFSRFDGENPIKIPSELDQIKKSCVRDPNSDYGFLHMSNLTTIEESLVFKIVKRITGERINYNTISNNDEDPIKEVTNYKEFFSKECWKKYGLTIERVNEILRNEALDLLKNSTNPYVTIKKEELDYPLKLARIRLDSVYNDTIENFNVIDDLKNLDKMDDNTYLQTMNKIVKTIHDINAEYKVDETIFERDNRVILTNEGLVDPREMNFFKVFSLYKWNGGHLEYDELKREYLLRKKLFICYDLVNKMPPNIIFNFVEDLCPDNHVCVDPNGIVLNSIGRDPRVVWADEIKSGSINFLPPNPKRLLEEIKKKNSQFRFKEKEDANIVEVDKDDKEMLYFDKLIESEQTNKKEIETVVSVPVDDRSYLNKFDTKYFERRTKIKKKKEIIINKNFDLVPLIGEILAIANIDKLDDNINNAFLIRETNLFKKYLIMWDASCGYVELASKLLLNLVLCNTDPNKTRFLLNELMEGLCYGDDKSIQIFKEIVVTLLLDSLIKNKYFLFEDLQAKFNLLNTLNKRFCFKTIVKIRFIESMLLLDIVKEKLVFIIMDNDTNEKVAMKIREVASSIPIQEGFPNNTREINFTDEEKEAKTIQRLFGSQLAGRKHTSMRFLDSGLNNMLSLEGKEKDDHQKPHVSSESFFKFKNIETDLTPQLTSENDKIKNTIEHINELREKLSKEIKDNSDLSNISMKIDKTISNISLNNTFKLSEILKDDLKSENKTENNKYNDLKPKTTKEKKRLHLMKGIKKNNVPQFKSIEDKDENFADLSLSILDHNDFVSQEQTNPLRVFKTPSANSHFNQVPITKTFSIMPNSKEIMDTIMQDSNTNAIIQKAKQSKAENKILYPKEIHAQYKTNRNQTKSIIINGNNPTKKLIIDKLMDERSFNDLMGQQEKSEPNDPTGLFNVLKNIQNRRCSCGYICIEIGK